MCSGLYKPSSPYLNVIQFSFKPILEVVVQNYDGDIYVHTGLITSESQVQVIGNMLLQIGMKILSGLKCREALITQIYIHKIGLISEFYNIDNTSSVIKLAMVFRSSDGTLEGKGPNFTDIFIPIIKDGIHVKFENPLDLNTRIISTKKLLK